MRIMKSWPALALVVAMPAFAQGGEQAEPQAEKQELEQKAEQEQQQQQPRQAQQQPMQQLPAPELQAPLGQQPLGAFGHMGMGGTRAYSVGTVQGTVTGLDFQRGIISLVSSAGQIALRARPMDIVNLNPGDVVAVQFANYQGALWLVPQPGQLSPQHFAQFGTLTGTVTAVNKSLGTIVVRGQTLRAHPEQLEAIIPGQFISIGYANVAGTNWVADVAGASGYGLQGAPIR